MIGVILLFTELYEDLSKSEMSLDLYRQNGWVKMMNVGLGEVVILKRK